MAINNQTQLASVLKRHYAKTVGDTTFEKNPLLARIKKDSSWGGENAFLPVKIALGAGGGSATIANAITNSSGMEFKHWLLTSTKNFHVASVDGETWVASKHRPDAFIDAAKEAMSSALQEMANVTSIQLFRDGKGVRGRIASTQDVTLSVITLSDPLDAVNFEVGHVLVASTSAAGTGIKQTASVNNTATITGVDRDA